MCLTRGHGSPLLLDYNIFRAVGPTVSEIWRAACSALRDFLNQIPGLDSHIAGHEKCHELRLTSINLYTTLEKLGRPKICIDGGLGASMHYLLRQTPALTQDLGHSY